MGDSDEEFDRRRGRDKFRRERNDYDRRDDRRRDQWEDRGGQQQWEDKGNYRGGQQQWNQRDRRESYGRDYNDRHRERYSPGRQDISPPVKRFKRDWEGDRNYSRFDNPYQGAGAGGNSGVAGPVPGNPPQGAWAASPGDAPVAVSSSAGPRSTSGQGEQEFLTQPAQMSFKAFLVQQDDNISDEDAIRKYNEYKLDFRKQQISEFFLAHKDEEWFKAKYHPEECDRRKEECQKALKRRAQVFLLLLRTQRIKGITCDFEHYDNLVKMLDSAVILMEGGREFDLTVLESQPQSAGSNGTEEAARSRKESESQPPPQAAVARSPVQVTLEVKKDVEEGEEGEEGEEKATPEREEGEEDGAVDDEDDKGEGAQAEVKSPAAEVPMETQPTETEEGEEKKEPEKPEEGEKKKKRREKSDFDSMSGSESESGSVSDSDGEQAPPGEEPPPPGMEGVTETPAPAAPVDPPAPAAADTPAADADPVAMATEEEKKEKKKDGEGREGEEEGEHCDELKPQAYHKTYSIFLRNLAPTITKQEVEAMCKRYPGFLRVALQDPQPERKFFRRGWVTFDRTVNIKDICWNLNNIRLRECEMGAIVNRELRQRIRAVDGVAAHKPIAKADIKHAAKIVQNFDDRWKIWDDDEEEKKDTEKESFGLVSKNPVLKNITDYLVDEGSYEEEAYFAGESLDDRTKSDGTDVDLERDEELLSVLDRMIYYLRLVHSYDFYSCVEYPNEDEMPHRCGIMHARGSPPNHKLSLQEVNERVSHFENKVTPYLNYKFELGDDESARLGKKDPDEEVEKFILANTQELAKDKWLCPLSGKKFKGPDFVRKHIQNKHGEKVDEVRKEVAFFNNYLLDPKRPQLPDHPNNRSGGGGGGGGPPSQHRPDGGGFGGPPHGGFPQNPHQHQGMGGGYQQQYHRPYGYQGRGRGRGRGYNQHHHYQSRGGGGGGGAHDHFRRDFRADRGGSSGGGGGAGGGGNFYKRDRSRPDPRGIIEYRDLDAPEDTEAF